MTFMRGALAAGCALCSSTALAQADFVMFDYPGSQWTQGAGLNDKGDVVGTYQDGAGDQWGFLRLADGTLSQIQYPGSAWTWGSDINTAGVIVGVYGDPAPGLDWHPFRVEAGVYSPIDTCAGADISSVDSIADSGAMVGHCYGADGVTRGVIWDADGALTLYEAPGAVSTALVDINDLGVILGDQELPDGTFEGFLLDGGVVKPLVYPGSAAGLGYGINNLNDIVGGYEDNDLGCSNNDGSCHGYWLACGGNYRSYDGQAPGVTSTVIFDVNDRRQITGWVKDSAGVTHGFLRSPAKASCQASP